MPSKPPKRGTSKINFLHSILQILAIGTCHGPYKHPHAKGWLSKWWKFWEKKFWKKKFLKKKISNFFFFQIFFLRIFTSLVTGLVIVSVISLFYCNFGFCLRGYGTDIEIRYWFRFPIPILNFGRTLLLLISIDMFQVKILKTYAIAWYCW